MVDFISDLIASGTGNQRKALIETLVAEIKITAAAERHRDWAVR